MSKEIVTDSDLSIDEVQKIQSVCDICNGMSFDQYKSIYNCIKSKNDSNVFVFGVGSDSNLWYETNKEGKTIFLEQGCAACHTLADAKAYGEMGPNLNQIKPDIARVIKTVTNGIGVMPPYEGVLSTQEIKAVAHYVSISATE